MFCLLSGSVEYRTLSSAPRVNPAGANQGYPTESFNENAPRTGTDGGTCTLIFVVGS